MDDDAVIGDLESVTAAQKAAAAELDDLQEAFGCPPRQLVGQLDDAVHHRVLGRDLGALGAGEHEHRALGRDRDRLQLVNELVERLLVLCGALNRDDPVEHQDGGTTGRDLAAQQGQQPLEALIVQHAEAVE